MMCLTFVDVVARYLFTSPIRGGFELTELTLLVLIFAGLPLVSHGDEHVTMDFIDRMLPPRALDALGRIVHALVAAMFFFLTWHMLLKAGRIAGYADTTFVTRAGMSQELFRAAYSFIGHRRGGLAMATITGCAGFGAICGSSIAAAATSAKVAYPSMKKFSYADYLSTGAIAAGGTLGILIPPSTIMVINGIMTETNIGKLFAAGVLPGILATVLLCLTVQYVTWRDPRAGPRGERTSWRERWSTIAGLQWFLAVGIAIWLAVRLGWVASDNAAVIGAFVVFLMSLHYKGVSSVIALFTLVMGGIYGGVFTAVEGAGVGAFGAMV